MNGRPKHELDAWSRSVEIDDIEGGVRATCFGGTDIETNRTIPLRSVMLSKILRD
jgi:hypothetical protein